MATATEQKLWKAVHSKKKYVFSRTQQGDNKASFIQADVAGRVLEIRRQPGRNKHQMTPPLPGYN